MERESLEFDIIIVGAGPAGLSCACKLKQLNPELNVAVLEKGSEVGAHILSGAVMEPGPLSQLFPQWQQLGAPLNTEVQQDLFYWLRNDQSAWRLPNWLLPKTLANHGNYVISLAQLCRWLAKQATELEVEILEGFPAAELLIEEGRVVGVLTADIGTDSQGQPKDSYQPGYELRAQHTVLAEGCRGHLTKRAIKHFGLDSASCPPHYGIGFKELWRVKPEKHQRGLVMHSIGYPLGYKLDGGGFCYHLDDDLVSVGLVVSLSYTNPWLSPFEEFNRFKQHPLISSVLTDGERLAYGARALHKGGLYSLPKLQFPGGLLIGDAAGFLNPAKIKGSHTAIASGMLAAETLHAAGQNEAEPEFDQAFASSELRSELDAARNFPGAIKKYGSMLGGARVFIEQNILRRPLGALKNNTPDYACLQPAEQSNKIDYPAPDGKISFDRQSSVYLSNVYHEEDQPCHLQLSDASVPLEQNLPKYAEPAQRYCPAGVYEVLDLDGKLEFRINASNCIHCKTCDIKDPAQNITWVVPEGGGGPNYPNT